jgi:hypothetical protein
LCSFLYVCLMQSDTHDITWVTWVLLLTDVYMVMSSLRFIFVFS